MGLTIYIKGNVLLTLFCVKPPITPIWPPTFYWIIYGPCRYMYKVEAHIFDISTEPIFWVYNAQVTPVLSISWFFVVIYYVVVFVLWHPTYRSGSQNKDAIQLYNGLGECLAIQFVAGITDTSTVPYMIDIFPYMLDIFPLFNTR